MKYTLSKGTVLRREWFGCLCYQAYGGHFWQFNRDAFDILRRLKTPLTVAELRKDLIAGEMTIGDRDLKEFLDIYEKQGLISQRNEASEILVLYEGGEGQRTDCLIAPSSVTIYMTDYCPKSCRHCATNAHQRVNTQDELTENDWLKVIRQLREAGVITLVISGGEPLAIPHTENIIKKADELQFGLTLLTDYDEITEQQIINLKSLKHPIYIQTSLDGATPESHDFLRGKGSFFKTLRRLQMFKDAGLPYTVAVAIHKKNIGELDEIADLAYENGASYVYFNAVAPYGRAKKKMRGLILDDEQLKYLAQTCLRLTDRGNIKTRNPFWKSELSRLGDEQFHPLANTLNAMSLGIYNFAISSKGDCHLDAKQRAENFLKLGNILETDLLTMWNDPRLDKLRSMHLQENFTFADQSKIETALAST